MTGSIRLNNQWIMRKEGFGSRQAPAAHLRVVLKKTPRAALGGGFWGARRPREAENFLIVERMKTQTYRREGANRYFWRKGHSAYFFRL